jgi:hypothetical protein
MPRYLSPVAIIVCPTHSVIIAIFFELLGCTVGLDDWRWLVIGRIDDHVHGWLDGCIGGWLGEYINSRLDGFIDGCLDNSVNAWLERQPDGSLERWLDSHVSGWIDDCNGWRYCRRCCRLCHTIPPSSSCFELTPCLFMNFVLFIFWFPWSFTYILLRSLLCGNVPTILKAFPMKSGAVAADDWEMCCKPRLETKGKT